MGTTEIIILLEQLLQTAKGLGMGQTVSALADNIMVFAQFLEREAARRRPLRRRWTPWWHGMDEASFKALVRVHLKEAGADAERLKLLLEAVADLKKVERPVDHLRWVDEVAAEGGLRGGH